MLLFRKSYVYNPYLIIVVHWIILILLLLLYYHYCDYYHDYDGIITCFIVFLKSISLLIWLLITKKIHIYLYHY